MLLAGSVAVMASWHEMCVWLQYSNSANEPPAFDGLHRFVWSTVQGALLAALLLIAANYFQHRREPFHPGHWILLLNSLLIPVALLAHTILSIQIATFGDDSPPWIYKANDAVYLIFYIVLSAFWLIPLQRHSPGRLWSVTYALYLALSTIIAISCFTATVFSRTLLSSLIYPTQFVVLAFIVAAAISDLLHGNRRDWLHWFGLAVTFFAYLLNPIVNIISVSIAENAA